MLGQTVTRKFTATPGDRNAENLAATVDVLTIWVVASAVAILVWSTAVPATATSSGWRTWLQHTSLIFGQAILVASGALAIGALLGFLFGIPRTIQEQPAPSAPAAGPPEDADRTPSLQAVNTNLEQISDWLTKILVGVSLTQLHNARGELLALATFFAVADARSVTLAIILDFAVAGFFSGYLLTRLFLAGAFVDVERSIRDRTNRAERLHESGYFQAASDEYRSALKQITPATPKDEKTRIYEGLIFNSLYEPWPTGFQKAIDYATRYQTEEPGASSPRILAYLAGAYGQQYTCEKQRGASPDRLQEIRVKALQAAKQALEANPLIIELLRMMWDPNYPSKSPGDDDLEPFYDDPEFKALLSKG